MPIQTSILTQHPVGAAGQIADAGPLDIVSGLCSSRKLVSVAIGASNSQTYTVTINGHDFSYTADGSATTAEIAAGLVAAISGGTQPVTATGTDTPILIESTLDGAAGDFTTAYSAGTGTLTETVLVAQDEQPPFGVFVCVDERAPARGALDVAVRLPRQSSDVTGGRAKGVTVDKIATELATYASQTMLDVLRVGRIFVLVEETVAAGDAAYVRYAAGSGGTQLGAFRKSVDSSTAAALPNATFVTGAAAGKFAVLQLNLAT